MLTTLQKMRHFLSEMNTPKAKVKNDASLRFAVVEEGTEKLFSNILDM